MADPSPRVAVPPVLRDVLVGVPLLLLLLAVMTGGFGSAIALLLMSVICTGGIASVFWLLLAFLLGAINMALFALLVARVGGPRLSASWKGLGSGPSLPVIASYVERRRQAGGDDDHIRADLLRGGWSPADVEAALAVVERGDDRC
ncbi:MAG: hypothetical protein ACOYMY_07080 [Prochlorococcaceae cyanobacterium]|jgi:hypothetical protein